MLNPFRIAAVPVLSLIAGVFLWGAESLGGVVDGTNWVLLGWNNLGMHCMDDDYSVFSILPPFNTVNAQLLWSRNGTTRLVTNGAGAFVVTYEAVADLDGSRNTTAIGKTEFWSYEHQMYGADLPPDTGLTGMSMPGTANVPQAMVWETDSAWFAGNGIPITPWDDRGLKNPYPMMRLRAKRASDGVELASLDVVLPVSDEMDCRACHGSGAGPAAEPSAGWVYDPNASHDYRLNILRLHDEHHAASSNFIAAAQAFGYSTNGLYPTALGGTSILCAKCHESEALPGFGFGEIPPLTRAVHALHAGVTNPSNGLVMDAIDNRSACYQCHPGSATRCLRGAMGGAIAADGSTLIQCQSCHGNMSAVGSASRTGWLDEPNCQACHTGTATSNNGQIRYNDVFSSPGVMRVAVNDTFGTNPDTPDPGVSLYRFSSGHGGLQCSACHGSTHAEFPSVHRNDNVASHQVQGHVGTIQDCTACHQSLPNITTNGPHGMHPIGLAWVKEHHDVPGGVAQCQACHGTDYRGTVLSRAAGDREYAMGEGRGTVRFWRGFQVSCYACHNGINSSSPGPNQPPIVTNRWLAVAADGSNAVSLAGNDPNGNTLSYRVVSQPMYGSVALNTNTGLATYIAEPGYTGPDFFTFTAWDGYVNSTNLAVVSVTVGGVGSLAQDPDGDGLSDLAEYGLGMASRFNSLPGAPRAELIQQGADKFLSLTANRLFVPPDVSMRVEESTNLVDWFSDGAHVVTVSNSATVLKARSATPAQSIPKDFLRLKATRP